MTDKPDFVGLHATVKSIGDDDEFPGRFEVMASTKALDRDGESMRPGALTLPESAPFYVDHDWKDGALPIGRGVPAYEGDVMKAVGSYASTARGQEIRTLVREGIIDSCSVGFLNGKRETTKGIREVVSGDLFEISFTAIPVNPEARVLASKALEVVKAGARNSATDASNLQQIHDLAVSNGADCGSMKSIRAGAKAIDGSYEAIRERVADALEDAYGSYCCWIRGVLPDVVIFDSGEDTYRQSYTDDGAVVTLTGARTEVDVHEVVVPDADAATEPAEGDDGATTLSLSGPAAGDAPAPAGASPADQAAQAKAIATARMRSAGLLTG